jgi:signal transduction histidine kinase
MNPEQNDPQGAPVPADRNNLPEGAEHRLALQALVHRLFAEQETGRETLSHTLHDDIGQTLLGIQVRLLALKRQTAVHTAAAQKEVAITKQLVDDVISSIKRFAGERGPPHEA